MKADVISDSGARGKRANAWGGTLWLLAVLGFITAALYAASLQSSLFRGPPPFPKAPPSADEYPMLPPPLPELAEVDIRLDLTAPPAPRRRARTQAASIAADPEPLGYEIVSEAELAAISQARD